MFRCSPVGHRDVGCGRGLIGSVFCRGLRGFGGNGILAVMRELSGRD